MSELTPLVLARTTVAFYHLDYGARRGLSAETHQRYIYLRAQELQQRASPLPDEGLRRAVRAREETHSSIKHAPARLHFAICSLARPRRALAFKIIGLPVLVSKRVSGGHRAGSFLPVPRATIQSQYFLPITLFPPIFTPWCCWFSPISLLTSFASECCTRLPSPYLSPPFFYYNVFFFHHLYPTFLTRILSFLSPSYLTSQLVT